MGDRKRWGWEHALFVSRIDRALNFVAWAAAPQRVAPLRILLDQPAGVQEACAAERSCGTKGDGAGS